MGYNTWSNDFYTDRNAARAKSGKSAFEYHEVLKKAPVAERKCHAEMDPKGVTRESRDSDEHPDSLAVAVILDQTGSMHTTPIVLQKALGDLMKGLIDDGVVAHPQVLFGCVGDETNGERASLQIGQFESGIEMDDDLGKMYMEGMGGGSNQESYQNAIYFFARHTAIDCHEKRGVKGKLFIVGDEHPYPTVKKHEIEKLFGDKVQDDIPVADIVREAQEKWDIYFLIPSRTSHGRDPNLYNAWVKLLGDEKFVVRLEDASQVCGAVATAIKGEPVAPAIVARTARL